MGLTDLFIVIGLNLGVHKFIIRNPSINQKKLVVSLVIFLYASFLFGYYINEKTPNPYVEVGIPRSMPLDEITKIYKEQAKLKHPDKNQSPYAQQEFIKMQENFKIIKSSDLRLKYELYGTIEAKKIGPSLAKSFPFYLSNFLLANGIPYSKENGYAGRNALLLLSGLALYEYKSRYQKSPFFYFEFLPLTINEQIESIQAIFPALILGLMLMNNVSFVSKMEETRAKFIGLSQDLEFRDSMIKIIQEINSENTTKELKSLDEEIRAIQHNMLRGDKDTGRSILYRIIFFIVISNLLKNFLSTLDEH